MLDRLMLVSEIREAPENKDIYGIITWEDAATRELYESVREHGLLEPLTVSSDRYLISGHRRFFVLQALRITIVKVRIDPVSYTENREEFLQKLVEANEKR